MDLGEISADELLDGFPEPALVIDDEGRVVYGNPAAAKLLCPAGFGGQPNITTFMPEDERSRLQPLDWLRRWGQRPDAPELQHVFLYCLVHPGVTRPMRVRVGRLSGHPSLYVVMLQDAAVEQERRHAHRQIQRLAARQLAISADAIISVDADQQITYANASAHEMLGYAMGELVGTKLAELIPERFRAAHGQFITQFASEASPARLMGERAEIVGLRSDGREIPMEASIAKITTHDGIVYTAHLRDITQRKQSERHLTETMSSLSTVFDNALQAMALIDAAGRVQRMNPAARKLLPDGVQPEGEIFSDLPFFADDATATAQNLREAVTECLSGRVVRRRVNIAHPIENLQTLDFSLTPVMTDAGVHAVVAEARNLVAD